MASNSNDIQGEQVGVVKSTGEGGEKRTGRREGREGEGEGGGAKYRGSPQIIKSLPSFPLLDSCLHSDFALRRADMISLS